MDTRYVITQPYLKHGDPSCWVADRNGGFPQYAATREEAQRILDKRIAGGCATLNCDRPATNGDQCATCAAFAKL